MNKTEKKKAYLTTKQLKALKNKAADLGIEGRGWFSKFCQFLSTHAFAILDSDFQKLLRNIELEEN